MADKVLVVQVLIGVGKIRSRYTVDTNIILRDYFCTSIKRWAESCHYDYQLITAAVSPEYLKHFKNESMFYNFQRFFHFRDLRDYDYIAYFDADIYAPLATDGCALPLKKGLSARIMADGVDKPHTPFQWSQVDKTFDAKKLKLAPFVNGGVLLLDSETAPHFANSIIARVTTRPTPTGRHQGFIWEYVANNLDKFNPLDKVWNLINRREILKNIELEGHGRHFIHCATDRLADKKISAALNIPNELLARSRK